MRAALTSILMLVCATGAEAGPPVSRADKADIVTWARRNLADPYSLRSTYISERTVVRGVEVVCVEFNARNQAGGYTGVDRHPFVDTPQGLRYASMRSDVTSATCYSPEITLKPFPELSAIK